MGKKILVVGSMNMDMVMSLDRMPKEGETVHGRSLEYLPGGKGANQACAVGRLGGDGCFLGCAGEDAFGRTLVGSLEESGIQTEGIRLCPGEHTGTAVIYVDSQGANSIVVAAGANAGCDMAYLAAKEELFSSCDYLVLQLEIPEEAAWYAIRLAKAYGKTVLLNPAPAPDRIPDEILRQVDYLIPNETELARLCGLEEVGPVEVPGQGSGPVEDAARQLLQRGVGKVLVTLGAQGALLVGADGCRYFPGREVQPVDTTAAGDCFIGAFTVGLSEGMEEGEAAAFANAAAALAVGRQGAQASLPWREELEYWPVEFQPNGAE